MPHRNTFTPCIAIGLALLSVVMLSGCVGTVDTDLRTPTSAADSTPAAVVTAPAAPVTPAPATPSPNDPLTASTAWDFCKAATLQTEGFDPDDWIPVEYDEQLVSANASNGFDVTIYFAPASGEGYGAGSRCVASGTFGSPVVTAGGLYGLG